MTAAFVRGLSVEGDVEREHIHAGLAQHPPLAALGVPADQIPDDGLVELSRLGHASDLVQARPPG